jgi:hypothetical protein
LPGGPSVSSKARPPTQMSSTGVEAISPALTVRLWRASSPEGHCCLRGSRPASRPGVMVSHADPRSPDRLSFAAGRLRNGENSVNDSQRRTVGPWTLDERLGRGGNAQVWRATRSGSAMLVALKLINTTKVER